MIPRWTESELPGSELHFRKSGCGRQGGGRFYISVWPKVNDMDPTLPCRAEPEGLCVDDVLFFWISRLPEKDHCIPDARAPARNVRAQPLAVARYGCGMACCGNIPFGRHVAISDVAQDFGRSTRSEGWRFDENENGRML